MYHIPGTPLAETLSGFFVGDWAMAKILGVLVAALVAWGSAAQAEEQGRWQQLKNKENCAVWNAGLHAKSTVTWSGVCVNGKAQGRGTQVWRYLEDGDWKENKYTGDLKDGKSHGRGVFEWASGDRYEGDWKDGKFNGRGVLVFANGDRYEGDYRDGKEHGRGVYVWADGARYAGDYRDGKRHGRGVNMWADGERYEGGWKDARREQAGQITFLHATRA